MSRPGPVNTFFFWLMTLLGVAVLAPCLVLPPWLEYQAQLECLKAHRQYLAALETQLRGIQKQIEHLNTDPAYVLRLAQQDFGGSFKVPDIETIPVDAGPDSEPDVPTVSIVEDAPQPEPILPELTMFLEDALRRYPYAQAFVDERTRPLLMTAGGVLLVGAIVFLGLLDRGGRRAVLDAPPRG